MSLKTLENIEKVKVEISQEVVTRFNKDGSVILMDINDEEVFYKATAIAALIIKELSEGRELISIAKKVLNEYEVCEETLCKDIDQLISVLKDNSLATIKC